MEVSTILTYWVRELLTTDVFTNLEVAVTWFWLQQRLYFTLNI